MGTDIHGIIERRNGKGWEPIQGAYFPDSRNYNVFSILADVRNGSGFAGIKTGEGFNPIAKPRGLPAPYTTDDPHVASVVEDGDSKWLGDHSYSWLTLREVLEYDYDQETTLCGYLTLEQYAKLEYDRKEHRDWQRELPCPDSWSGGIDGPGIVKIDEDEARTRLERIKEQHPEAFTKWGMPSKRFYELVDDKDEWDRPRTYVFATWPRRYLDSMSGFLAEMLRYTKYGLDDVRLVFGFDS